MRQQVLGKLFLVEEKAGLFLIPKKTFEEMRLFIAAGRWSIFKLANTCASLFNLLHRGSMDKK